MRANTTDLLYQSSDSLLVNREAKLKMLQLLEFFVSEMIDALISFYFNNNLNEFDPHVGDTLCQIRAYMFCIMKSQPESYLTQLKKEIENLTFFHKKIEDKISEFDFLKKENTKYNKQLDSQEKISEFLKRNEILFHFSNDTLLLMQARILSLYSKIDEFGISRGVNYEKLCNYVNISKSLAKRLMHNFQANLARNSSVFIRKLLTETMRFRGVEKFISHLQFEDADNRQVLPCYLVTKIILEHALIYKHPILVRLEQWNHHKAPVNFFLFVPNDQGNYELRHNLYGEYLNTPCIVVSGYTSSQYINRLAYDPPKYVEIFRKTNLMKILLANMATHPQYSAREFENISYNPYEHALKNISHLKSDRDFKTLEKEFLDMKLWGEQKGCCIENNSLFLIKHIFCDYPKHQLYQRDIKLSNNKVEYIKFNNFKNELYSQNIY